MSTTTEAVCEVRQEASQTPIVLQNPAEPLPAKRPPIVFVHIPKTAGTSFSNYMLSSIAPDQVSAPFHGNWSTLQIDNPDIRFFWGHFAFRHADTRFANAYFITFIRDPIQRAISQYRSWHNPANFMPGDGWYENASDVVRQTLTFAQRSTLEEFVHCNETFQSIILRNISNLQTMMLASHVSTECNETLASAVYSLFHRFCFFGVAERFEESLLLLREQFPELPQYNLLPDRENRSAGEAPVIHPSVRRRLGQLNSLDSVLYDNARRVFDKRLRKAGIR